MPSEDKGRSARALDDCLALEERIMFDGAAAADLADHLADTADSDHAPVHDRTDAGLSLAVSMIPENSSGSIYFIDGSLSDLDRLVSAVPEGGEVVILDPTMDGVEQVALVLGGRSGLDAIHIISHGGQGELTLGTATLDTASMQGEYFNELTTIGEALTANGDILIYGCDFTGGEAGLDAAIVLGGITGADVAASIDPTGHADFGGDWDLETEVGEIEAQEVQAEDWDGLLAPPVATDDSVVLVPGVATVVDVIGGDYGNGPDSDADGDTLTLVSIEEPANPGVPIPFAANATVTLASGTTVTFGATATDPPSVTKPLGANGAETFDYAISDGNGGTDVGRVTLRTDSDLDGIQDSVDVDDDNDGVLDVVEQSVTYSSLTGGVTVSADEKFDGSSAGNNDLGFLTDGDTGTEPEIGTETVVEYDLGQTLLAGTQISFTEGTSGNDGNVEIYVSNGTLGPGLKAAIDGGAGTLVYSGPSDADITITVPFDATHLQIVSLDDKAGWGEMELTSLTQVIATRDSDGDGVADHLDIDKDNDGITDNVEAQTTAGYVAPSGQGAAMVDLNTDGLDDNYAGGVTEVDTDGDGTVDTLDLDSDDDGAADVAERGDGGPTATPAGPFNDADLDGLLDEFEGASTTDGYDVNDENIAGDDGGSDGDYTNFTLADSDLDTNANEAVPGRTSNDAVVGTTDLDYRDNDDDTDGDGVQDSVDIDDDNDGILDVVEQTTTFSALSNTTQYSFAQNNLGNLAQHYPSDLSVPGADNPLNLFDGDINTELRLHSYDVFEYDFGQVIPAGTSVTLVEGPGGEDTGVAIYVSLTSADPNGDTLAALGTGSGIGYANTIASSTLIVVPTTDVSGTPATNLSYGVTPADASVTFIMPHDARFLQMTGDPANQHGGWAELEFTTLTQTIANLDSDGDGRPDHLDIDKDNDGITDNVEAQSTAGYVAPSGQGTGIIDADGDGLDDNYDANDGNTDPTASAGLTEVDTDGDGTVDTLDLDSDDDGAADVAERGDGGPTATPIAPFNDADNDGLLDEFEGASVADGFDVNDENITGDDGGSDGDYTSIALADSDLDTDANEASPGRTANDAVAETTDLDYRDNDPDSDLDGIQDSVDVDDDNDGVLDVVEQSVTYSSLTGGVTVSADEKFDGSSAGNNDLGFLTDGDTGTEPEIGTETVVEYDLGQTLLAGTQISFTEGTSGNDGNVEIYVSNGTLGPGLKAAIDGGAGTLVYSGPSDADITITVPFDATHLQIVSLDDKAGWGEMELTSLTQVIATRDSDGDGVADHLDIDKDNDGITDNVEAQTTAGYVAPSGQGAAMVDLNTDGLDDNYAGGVTEVDTDGDGTVDTLDLDSDDDGAADVAERGDGGPTATPAGPFNDADLDGLLDEFEGASTTDGYDVNDENIAGDDGGSDGDYTNFTLADSDLDTNANEAVPGRTSNDAVVGTTDLDYRDNDDDTDGDGVQDSVDIDDDNDGILDVVEQTTTFSALSNTTQYSFAQNNLGNLAQHYPSDLSVPGADNPLNLFDGDINTELRLHSYDVFEYDFGQVIPAGTSVTLVEGPGGEDTGVAIYVSLTSADPNGDTLAALGTGSGIGYANTIASSTLIVVPTTDVSGTPATNLSYGVTPADASVTFIMPHDARFLQMTGDPANQHGGWAELEFTTLTQTIANLDSDGDGRPDHLDIDKDNDGITDNVEAQSTAGYVAPSGQGTGIIDADGDGLDDNYDANDGNTDPTASAGLTEVDTDGDGTVDTLDLDSDDDGAADVAERGDGGPTATPIAPFNDADNDGLLDEFEGASVADGFDVNDENITGDDGGSDGDYTSIALADSDLDTDANEASPGRTANDAVAETTDLDYRDNDPDSDLDGIQDSVDVDDDNDGVLDVVEQSVTYSSLTGGVTVSADEKFDGSSAGNNDLGFLTDGDTGTEPEIGTETVVEYDLGQTLLAGTQISFTEGTSGNDGNVEIYVSNGTLGPGLKAAIDGGAGTLVYSGPSDADITITVPFDATHLQIVSLDDKAGWGEMELTSLTQVIATRDSDGDGVADHLDIDKDNDGITDNVEAQTTAGYVAPSGQGAAMVDLNTDGLDDNYAGGVTEVDTDGDGTVDTLDLDSDDDGAADVAERGDGGPTATPAGPFNDADLDGLLDEFEGASTTDGYDVNDENIAGDDGGSDGDYTNFTLADSDLDTNANEAVPGRTSNDAVALDSDLDFRDDRLDLSITGLDDGSVAGSDGAVSESDLATGSTPSGTGEVSAGTFVVTAPDGIASLDIADTTLTLAQLDATDTTPVTITGAEGDLTITGFDPTTGVVSYSYTLTGPADHSGGAVIDDFAMTLTDDDGDTQTGTLGLLIADDTPSASDDVDAVTEDATGVDSVADGNVFTGTGGTDSNATDGVADTLGADTVATPVTGVAVGTGTPSGTNIGTGLAGTYGTLTLLGDGSYSYALDNTNPAVQGLGSTESLSEVYTYEITDADGDTDTATLTLTITGSDDPLSITGLDDGSVAGSDGAVSESDLATGSTPSGTGEVSAGTFVVTAPDGIASLDIADTTLTLAQLDATDTTPVTITGAEGDLTITGFDPTTGVVSYSYTLTGPADHSGGAVIDDFAMTLTDDDGDTQTGTLGLLIADDTPSASDDVDAVTEDATGVDSVADGNVFTGTGGTDSNATDGVADTLGADTVATPVTGVAVGTGTPSGTNIGTGLAGTYGTLTLLGDGSYSYALDNTNPAVQGLGSTESLSEVYTYEITDADGDTDTATLTLTITGSDDPLSITGLDDGSVAGSDGAVSESDLATGSTPSGTGEVSAGTFVVTAPDGIASLDIADTTLTLAQLDATDTTPVTITGAEGDLTITGFDPTTGVVSYSYTLTGPADHSGGAVIDDFAMTLTDDDGDTQTGTLGLLIADDTPSASDDVDAVTEDATGVDSVADGNVFTGTGGTDSNATDGVADTLGADTVATPVTGVAVGTGTPSGTNIGTGLAGTYGTLTLLGDGSYSYALDNTNPAVQGLGSTESLSEVYTYEITDADGDTDTATLTLTITGSDDPLSITGLDDGSVAGSDGAVSESDLATGSTPSGTGEVSAGTFVVTAPDGIASLDIADTTLTLAQLDATDTTPVTITGAEGDLTITGFDPTTGVVSYSYTLTGPADHSGGAVIDDFAMTLTDDDGDTQTGTLGLLIADDTPSASDDVDAVTEDATGVDSVADGNVFTGTGGTDSNATDGVADTLGADTVATPVTGVAVGTGTPSGTNIGTGLAGTYGTLTLLGDGSYSYALDNTNPAVQGLGSTESLSEVYTYEITDADGDTDTATLTLTITGSDDPLSITGLDDGSVAGSDGAVSESDLATGSTPSGTGEVSAGTFVVTAPDGIASLDIADTTLTLAQLDATDTTPVTITGAEGDLTITGFDPTTGVVSYSYTLTGPADHSGGAVIDDFAMTLTDDDGDTQTGTLGLLIADDTPSASDDVDAVTEDATGVDSVADGNVFTGTGGTDSNATDGVADTLGADTVATPVTGVAVGTGTPSGTNIGTGLAGTYGTLTLLGDGSYSYALDNTNPAVQGLGSTESLSEVYTYEITDADGDTDTATLTLTITGSDDPLSITGLDDGSVAGSDGAVSESDLATGSTPSGTGEVSAGTFVVTAPDGIASLDIADTTLTLAQLDATDTTPVTITGAEGDLTITGFDPTTGVVSYSYTLTGPADHSGGAVIDDFAMTLTDDDGDTQTGTLGLLIADDTPSASDDVDAVTEDATGVDSVADGNVFTGTGGTDSNATDGVADTLGADTVATPVTGVAVGTGTPSGTNIGTGLAGTYGTLTLLGDGSYSYALDNTNPAVQGLGSTESLSEVYTYEITDADGDTDTATLTLTITGSDDPLSITGLDDGSVAGSDGAVSESDLATGSTPSGTGEVSAGTFVVTAPDGIASLDIADTTLTLAQLDATDTTPVTITGAEGDLTITGFDPTTGVVSYSYTLTGPADHSGGAVIDDFAMTLTDDDGDTQTGTLGLLIADDTPSASDDVDAVTEDATGVDSVADGNVFTGTGGTDSNATDGVADTLGADTVATPVTGVAVGTGTPSGTNIGTGLAGTYGTLTLLGDGSYSYALDNTNPAVQGLGSTESLSEVYTYEITDADGDTDTATLTLTITGSDDPLSITGLDDGSVAGSDGAVSESDLATGSTPSGTGEVSAGTFVVTAPDGIASLDIADTTLTLAQLDATDTTPVTITGAEGDLTITGFDPTTGVVSYSYTLTGPADHSGGAVIDDFAMTLTDDDGDTQTGTLGLLIADDTPSASDDVDAVTEDATGVDSVADGNVFTGTGGTDSNATDGVADTLGADTVATPVTGVAVGTGTPSGTNIGTGLAGTYGTLTLLGDGSYSYALDNTNPAVQGLGSTESLSEVYTYEITDADGDTDTATLTLTITGSDDPLSITGLDDGSVAGSDGAVSESDLATGSTPSGTGEVSAGTFVVTAPDGIASLDIADTTLTLAQLDATDTTPVTITGAEGDLTITGFDPTTGVVSYSYTLTGPADHSGGAVIDDFAMTLTDDDGDTQTGTLGLLIADDTPSASDDVDAVTEDATGVDSVADGNVFTGTGGTDSNATDGVADTLGADTVATPVTGVAVGTGTPSGTNIGTGLAGTYGTLTLLGDGSYSYALDNTNPAVQGLGSTESLSEVYTYEITDADGDTDTATLTLTITGSDDPLSITGLDDGSVAGSDGAVSESDLATGSTPSGTGEVSAGTFVVTAPDGIASLDIADTTLTLAQLDATDTTPVTITGAEGDLTITGFDPTTGVVSYSYTLTGPADHSGGAVIDDFAMTLTDDDGDTQTGTLGLLIADDTPSASDDVDAVTEDATGVDSVADGNVFTGTGGTDSNATDGVADTLGADTVATPVTGVAVGTGTPSGTNIGTGLAGTYGTLTLLGDGSYSYALDNTNPAVQGLGSTESLSEVYTYEITDADGDTDTATLTLTITGSDDPLSITGLDDGSVAGSDGAVSESDLATGSTPSGTGEVSAGTFVVTAPDGIASLDIADTTLTLAQLDATDTTPVTITGAEGDLTITGFDPTTGVVSYSYTLTGPADHSGGAVIDDFAMTLTDDDGDTQTGTLGLLIADDTPSASDDVDAVTEDATGVDSVADGNVFTGTGGTDSNATDGVADTLGADTVATPVTGVAVGTGTPSGTNIGTGLAGTYGTLTLLGDGSYSYALDNTNPAVQGLGSTESLSEVYTYEITDADGDTDTATLTLTITGSDDPLSITGLDDGSVAGSDGAVSESDLATGSTPSGTGEVSAGTFVVTAPDGIASLDIADTTLTLAQLDATDTTPVTITGAEGDLTITGFDPTTGVVSYSYTLTGPADHSGGAVIDDFAMTLTDDDGDTQTGTLGLLIADDTPSASDDVDAVTEDATGVDSVADGNVFTGTGGTDSNATDGVADTLGADTVATPVTGVAVGTGTPSGTNIGTGLAGTYGTLTLLGDGSYSYALDNTNPAVQGLGSTESLSEVYTYEITDADGDTDTATLTLTITGSDDPLSITGLDDGSVAGSDGAVSESDLATGSTPSGTGEVSAGTFVVTAPDGIASLDIADTTLTLAQLDATDTTPVTITGAEGDLTITGFDPTTGVVSYSYTLTGPADHSGGAVIDDFAMTLTDDDGDTQTGTLGLLIADDTPSASDDVDAVTEDATGVDSVADGNVFTGTGGTDSNATDGVADTLGADTVATPVTGVAVGTGTPSGTNIGTGLAGTYGTLTLLGDGSYSYALDNTNPAVQGLGSTESLSEVYTYEITDADGDTDTATLTLTITGSDDPLSITGLDDGSVAGSDGAVSESDLATGSTPSGTGEVSAGTFVVTAPDGIASLDIADTTLTLAQLDATDTTPVTITGAEGDLTITGFDPTTGVVSYSYTLTGPADHSGGAVIDDFAMTLTDDDGDTQTGTLGLLIADDTPSASDDVDAVTEDATGVDSVADGNVFTGTGGTDSNATDGVADTLGADTVATPVTGVAVGTGTPSGTNIGTGLAGTYGTLTLLGDGSYSYALDNTNPAVQGLGSTESLSEVYTYEITDADGDTDTATLTLTITGSDDPLSITGLDDGSVAGSDGAVSESDLATGSTPSGTGEVSAGTFVVTAPDGIASLDIADTTLTLAQLDATDTTPVTITGAEGDLTITGFDPTTGVVSYSYTLTGPADHSGGAVIDDFAMTLTDDDGDTQTGTLGLLIADDTPSASDDVDAVTEDATGVDSVADGNVFTGTGGTDSNATDGVADTLGADTVATPVTGVAVGTGTPSGTNIGTGLAGTYGTLTLLGDGSYSYALDNTNPAVQGLGSTESLSEVYTYEITDADGDTDTATLTLTITGSDDPLSITGLDDGSVAGSDGAVSESDLATGSTPSGTGEVSAGTFVVTAPDGIASLDIADTTLTLAQLDATDTTPVTITGAEGDLTITGFDPTTGVVSYSYTLTGPADHSGGAVIDDFAMTLTDDDGDTQTGTLGLLIADDTPSASDDVDAVTEDATGVDSVADGNVFTGTGGTDSNATDGVADTLGADTVATPVTGVAVGTGTPSGTNIGTGLAGTYGTLTLLGDGSYSYALDNTNPAVQGLGSTESLSEVYTYEITDADGDTDTATLTLTITGSDDPLSITGLDDGSVAGSDGAVSESDLATGSTPSGTGEVSAGTFVVTAPDGIASLDIADTTLTLAQLDATDTTPVTITGAEGDLTITGFDPTTGVVSYSYTLTGPADHSGGAVIDDFAMTLTDDDGDTQTGTLGLLIADDTPSASDDVDAVTEDATGVDSVADGNVFTGTGGTDSNATDGVADTLGADTVATPVTGVAVGTGTPSGTNIGTGLAGTYGTLTLLGDGSYSYALDNTNPAVQGLGSTESLSEVYTYEITDADGDTDTATLTLTITGVNDAPVAMDDSNSLNEDTVLVVPAAEGLLANDTDVDNDVLQVATFTTGGTTYAAGSTAVLAEGELVINSDGSYQFTPSPSYLGPVPIVTYVVDDGDGGTDTATLTLNVEPVADNLDSEEDPFDDDPNDDPRREPPGIIVDNTANLEDELFGTPGLLSNYGTDLGVKHPILTAVNEIQSMNDTPVLPTNSDAYFGAVAASGPATNNAAYFGAVAASGPVGVAVQGVGFDPLVNAVELFDRDFPGQDADHVAVPDGASSQFVTQQGFLVTATLNAGDDLQLKVTSPEGWDVGIRTVTLDDAAEFEGQVSEESGLGVTSTFEYRGFADIVLDTGQNLTVALTINFEEEIVDLTTSTTTLFSQTAEMLVFTDKRESAELMRAISKG